jgi:hypothetical protein
MLYHCAGGVEDFRAMGWKPGGAGDAAARDAIQRSEQYQIAVAFTS